MSSYNRVVLVGNVTRDPELKVVGKTYLTELGIAVNERVKDSSGQFVEKPCFVDVTLWAKTAEIACEYAKRGQSVLIEGRLTLDQWEKDGRKMTKLKVTGEKMQLLTKQEQKQHKPAGKPVPTRAVVASDEDIPF